MKPTQKLHALGQSLWLDNITREMLDDGTLKRYIDEFSVTGLTSNPTIFQKALAGGAAYDAEIAAAGADTDTEVLFIRLALADLTRAADLLRPVHDASGRMDGWVSMEVSPLLADDVSGTVEAARDIHRQAARDNLFIKIPGTAAGVKAIEESIFAGVPVNVTLLFSASQYEAVANAWMRGIERRLQNDLDPVVHSAASLFVSRWDAAVHDQVPAALRNRLGIAVAGQTWAAWRRLVASDRYQKLLKAGAPLQRLLWASTGTKDPNASDVLYVEALAAPDSINTIPDKTLEAFADHGRVQQHLTDDGGDSARVLAEFEHAGIDVAALAGKLQREGAAAFVQSWQQLMAEISRKR